ncbi:unnamed protein product [Toxocara canis]|uniref:Uncharacterized protein n=1 Tax=Toxocara canis TaxID=6265 RepID=A0A183VCR4_TOXCA|nr:unnamed protein product [Toxocara canis]
MVARTTSAGLPLRRPHSSANATHKKQQQCCISKQQNVQQAAAAAAQRDNGEEEEGGEFDIASVPRASIEERAQHSLIVDCDSLAREPARRRIGRNRRRPLLSCSTHRETHARGRTLV